MEKFKKRTEEGMEKLKNWISENPDKAAGVTGGIIIFGKMLIKELIKWNRRRADQRRMECRFFDRRTDMYCWSKRPLKGWEKRELEHRSRNGELKSDILAEYGLLKY